MFPSVLNACTKIVVKSDEAPFSGFLSKVRARVRLTLTLFVTQVLGEYHLIFFSSIYYHK